MFTSEPFPSLSRWLLPQIKHTDKNTTYPRVISYLKRPPWRASTMPTPPEVRQHHSVAVDRDRDRDRGHSSTVELMRYTLFSFRFKSSSLIHFPNFIYTHKKLHSRSQQGSRSSNELYCAEAEVPTSKRWLQLLRWTKLLPRRLWKQPRRPLLRQGRPPRLSSLLSPQLHQGPLRKLFQVLHPRHPICQGKLWQLHQVFH